MTSSGETQQSARSEFPLIAISCACLIALLAFGPRSAMGFFQLPILQETGWDRSTFGFAMALQNLFWGLGQPFFGAIADRYGTWRVLLIGALLYILGLVVMAFAATPLWLHIGGGILVGLGIAACSFGVILSSLARIVSPEKRSFAFGRSDAYAGEFFGMSVFKEFWLFLKKEKKWWLLPMVVVLLLLGALLVFAEGSSVAPFIYTLF